MSDPAAWLYRELGARGLRIGTDVFVAFSPERIDPGVASHAPDCTPRVVGGITPACTGAATAVLAHTASAIHPVSSPEAAEMTKLVETTFRAVNIAVANEFGRPAVRIARATSATVASAACQERCNPKSTASRMPT